MLLENITVATLSIQVKTFSFEAVLENSFPISHSLWDFTAVTVYPSGIQQLDDFHPD